MRNLRKFNTRTDYESATLIYPSVSKIVDENKIIYDNVAPQHDYSQDYLTFEALEDGTFTFTKAINYSTDDGTNWTALAAKTASPLITSGNKIMWKATLTPGSFYPSYGVGTFSSTGNFNVEGNAMSLLFGDNFIGQTDLTDKNYTLSLLFRDCSNLISAKSLSLPATTLAGSCYQRMFQNCISLTTAPELPATTLTGSCYYGMFYGCTSLTTAPALPAITLANNCYQQMFYGCTSLTTAPALPATTLASSCYYQMFYNCTSLNSITCLATDISADNCTGSWVSGVISIGTFTKAASMSSWPTGASGIPNGWTVVDK